MIPIEQKSLRGDRTAAEWNDVANATAAGGESCQAGFYFAYKCQFYGILLTKS